MIDEEDRFLIVRSLSNKSEWNIPNATALGKSNKENVSDKMHGVLNI